MSRNALLLCMWQKLQSWSASLLSCSHYHLYSPYQITELHMALSLLFCGIVRMRLLYSWIERKRLCMIWKDLLPPCKGKRIFFFTNLYETKRSWVSCLTRKLENVAHVFWVLHSQQDTWTILFAQWRSGYCRKGSCHIGKSSRSYGNQPVWLRFGTFAARVSICLKHLNRVPWISRVSSLPPTGECRRVRIFSYLTLVAG